MSFIHLTKLEVPLQNGASSIEIKEIENERIHVYLKNNEQISKFTDDSKSTFIIQMNDRTIGAAILTREKNNPNSGKLNYWMEYDYMTSGLGTIVAAEMIQYATKHLNLQSISSDCLEPLWGNGSEPFSLTL